MVNPVDFPATLAHKVEDHPRGVLEKSSVKAEKDPRASGG